MSQTEIDSLALVVSALSFLMAGAALGWNIYRDVILKARVKVRCSLIQVVGYGQVLADAPRSLAIEATNHGPGPVILTMVAGTRAGLRRRLTRKVEYFFVLYDHRNPLNAPGLPRRLEVGENATIHFPPSIEFIDNGATHIGFVDSFGRRHFAPRGAIEKARRERDKK